MTQLAKVTFGYEDYILPLKDATRLVEQLAALTPVEPVNYALASDFRPELAGGYVKKKALPNITLTLVDKHPAPYFNQDAELFRLRSEKFSEEIAPMTLSNVEGQTVLLDAGGNKLYGDYSFHKVIEEARRLKTQNECLPALFS